MKKLSFLLIALLAGAMMFTGCKKDPVDPEPTPDPTPQPTTKTVEYSIQSVAVNWQGDTIAIMSPCFHFNLSYTGADGNPVSLENVEAPWSQAITVEIPFDAKIEGTITFVEEELPETVSFCKFIHITYNGHSEGLDSHLDMSKEKFLENIVNQHPEKLQFTKSWHIE